MTIPIPKLPNPWDDLVCDVTGNIWGDGAQQMEDAERALREHLRRLLTAIDGLLDATEPDDVVRAVRALRAAINCEEPHP